MLIREVINFAIEFALSKLKGVTGDKMDKALDIVVPIFAEMLGQAIVTGQATLTPEFRKPYELKALNLLREVGLVEEF